GFNQQYRSWRGRALVDQLFPLLSGVAVAAVLILAAMSLYRGFEYSRLTLVYTAVIATVLLTVERYLLRNHETRLRRRGIGTDRVLVVGSNAAVELLIQRLSMFPQYGFQITGVLDDRLAAGTTFAGAPVLGHSGDLPGLIRQLGVQQVFMAIGSVSNEHLMHLLKICDDQQVDFKLIPDLLDIMRTGVEAAIIDGLQLVKALRGEMSLVGPRPERPFFVERFSGEVPRYLDRHQVRPGMTGWAQINDLRGDSSIAERTIYDIYYVENWTLALDLKILM